MNVKWLEIGLSYDYCPCGWCGGKYSVSHSDGPGVRILYSGHLLFSVFVIELLSLATYLTWDIDLSY